jgi:hypothetical protein
MRKQAMGTGEGSVTEPVGTVQALSHPVGQFLSMFVPGTSALKGAGMGTKGAAALSGFMADFASDPEAGNLANLAGDAYNAFSPEGQLALVEWLGTNKNAPELENRLKNAFLGSATGLGVDAVMSGLKMLKTRGQMNKLGETIRQAFAEAQGQRGSAVMGPSDEMVTLFRHGDVKGPTANFGESEGMVAPFAQAGPLRSLQVSKSDAETFRKSNLLKNPNVEQAIKDEILKQGGMPDLEYLLPDWLARAAKEHYAEGGLGAVLEALVGER